MKIAVTGSSGLLGSALVSSLLGTGHGVVRLKRPEHWDPERRTVDISVFSGADAIVHLAGENIAAARWTTARKQRIRDSRVNGTHLLSEAIARRNSKPKTFICASATGIYGDRDDEVLDEQSESGGGFLAGVCREWEKATEPANKAGVRVVNLRFGPILARDGGMLSKLLIPFKMGMGGKVGSGKQYISWIALDDAVSAIKLAIDRQTIHGPLNVVSPNPVTNEEFTKTLGHVLNRPTALAMPAFAARLAFGEMADEMLLASQKVIPKKLTSAGFQFQYPQLEAAMRRYVG